MELGKDEKFSSAILEIPLTWSDDINSSHQPRQHRCHHHHHLAIVRYNFVPDTISKNGPGVHAMAYNYDDNGQFHFDWKQHTTELLLTLPADENNNKEKKDVVRFQGIISAASDVDHVIEWNLKTNTAIVRKLHHSLAMRNVRSQITYHERQLSDNTKGVMQSPTKVKFKELPLTDEYELKPTVIAVDKENQSKDRLFNKSISSLPSKRLPTKITKKSHSSKKLHRPPPRLSSSIVEKEEGNHIYSAFNNPKIDDITLLKQQQQEQSLEALEVELMQDLDEL